MPMETAHSSSAFGIGGEQCTTSCCGTDVTMNETSREVNHKFLYFSNVLYILFSVVILVVGASNLGSTE